MIPSQLASSCSRLDVHICDRTCGNQPYGAICDFSLRAILVLGNCFVILFFLTKTMGYPYGVYVPRFTAVGPCFQPIIYRCIVYNLYVRWTLHGKFAIRINENLVDTMRYHGCRNFSRENEMIVRIPSI